MATIEEQEEIMKSQDGTILVVTEVEESDECRVSEELLPSIKIQESSDNLDDTSEVIGWTEITTKLLISAVNDLTPKVGHTFALKTKSKMWIQISQMLQEKSYNFTPLQCENRWKTLVRGFKKKRMSNKTGRASMTCDYERDLENALRKTMVKSVKKAAKFPAFALNSSGEGTSRNERLEVNGMKLLSKSPTSSNSRDSIILKRKWGKETIAGELKYFSELKIKQHREKLEAYRERTQAIEKRNALLEELVNSLKKQE